MKSWNKGSVDGRFAHAASSLHSLPTNHSQQAQSNISMADPFQPPFTPLGTTGTTSSGQSVLLDTQTASQRQRSALQSEFSKSRGLPEEGDQNVARLSGPTAERMVSEERGGGKLEGMQGKADEAKTGKRDEAKNVAVDWEPSTRVNEAYDAVRTADVLSLE